jgi:flagellin
MSALCGLFLKNAFRNARKRKIPMSSILTNNSAMVALETLRGINRNLSEVQSQISTGKKVSTAKDNAAIWAISTVMETDVASFKQITDSLNLGSSTVGVARSASEQVTNILQDMKELIVSAQEENVDRDKIQTDIDQLVNQVDSIVNAAQFNGQNLLKGGGNISVLSSLDRASDQSVSSASIDVNRVSLETDAVTVAGAAIATTAGQTTTSAASIADGATQTVTFAAGNDFVASSTAGATSGYSIQVGTDTVSYAAREGDTINDVVQGLKDGLDALNITGITVDVTLSGDVTANDAVLSITNNSGAAVNLTTTEGNASTAGGGLSGIKDIDVTDTAGAQSALNDIESLLQTAINASADFGSAQKRIDYQTEFVNSLSDSLKSGIGTLTDADIEEASARLQSLQVQQQLGIQALSIANQQPQQLLSLFR